MARLAIITGTSSGIGAALAERLLGEGWQVFGLSRRPVELPAPYQHLTCDLADPAVPQQLASRLAAELAFNEYSHLALVNNAATPGQRRRFGDLSAAETFRNMAINLAAPMALMNLVAELRPANAMLRVVNVSTGLAYRPLPGLADYCASKAGLHMAGEVLAAEDHGDMAVLSYAPGIVATEMQTTLRGETAKDFPSVDVFRAMHEENRLLAANQVLEPIVAFLLDASRRGFYQQRHGE